MYNFSNFWSHWIFIGNVTFVEIRQNTFYIETLELDILVICNKYFDTQNSDLKVHPMIRFSILQSKAFYVKPRIDVKRNLSFANSCKWVKLINGLGFLFMAVDIVPIITDHIVVITDYNQCDQIVKIKSSLISSKSFPKQPQKFVLKMKCFRQSPKVDKYLGYFCKQNLS